MLEASRFLGSMIATFQEQIAHDKATALAFSYAAILTGSLTNCGIKYVLSCFEQ